MAIMANFLCFHETLVNFRENSEQFCTFQIGNFRCEFESLVTTDDFEAFS